MRRLVVGFASAILCSLVFPNLGAKAALDAPELTVNADRYVDELRKKPQDGSAKPADLLSDVGRAEDRGKLSAAIEAYERLVRIEPKSFRAWLQLAAAWRKFNPSAEEALGAAVQANRVAGSKEEDFESLLMVAGVLRDRLSEAQLAFAQARQRILTIERQAAFTGIDLNAPPGNSAEAGELAGARIEAMRKSLVAADRVSVVLNQLDIVYGSIFNDPGFAAVAGEEAADLARAEIRTTVFDVARTNDPAEEEPPYDVAVDMRDDHSSACIRFTLPLDPKGALPASPRSYGNFLKLSDLASDQRVEIGSLQVDNDRLCLLLLEPGHDYALRVEAGLSAQNGAKLAGPVDLEINVPDRAATVGFRGASFILPRRGDGDVPLYTVNKDRVPLHLVRVTDRNLHRHIALGHIGNRMPPLEYEQMREQFSDELWDGSIEIEHQANKLTTSYIPILQILEGRREWLLGGPPVGGPDDKLTSPERLIGTKIKGAYTADSVSFQADQRFDGEAGVYALVTDGSPQDKDVDPDEDGRCIEYCAGHYVVQWIVRTDIGLAFYETESSFHVIARSLATGGALTGVAVQLVAANNRVLAEDTTKAEGVATFPRRLTEGTRGNRLAVVLARTGDDFSFIDFGKDRLDLSKLSVYGRKRPGKLDAFLYTDRGIYRPGNSLALTAIVRDSNGVLPKAVPPITLQLKAGETELAHARIEATDWKLGGVTTALDIPATARVGAAELRAYVADDESQVIGSTIVQIDRFRPDRARLDFNDKQDWQAAVGADDTLVVSGSAAASYLFGDARIRGQAAASGLRDEVDIRLEPAESPVAGCYADYSFAEHDEPSPKFLEATIEGTTDDKGIVSFVSQPIPLPDARQPLAAGVTVTVFDDAGPLASRTDSIPLRYGRDWIGVVREPRLTPADADGSFGLTFDVVGFGGDNSPLADRSLTFELYRERNVFVWQNDASVWKAERDVALDHVSEAWPAERKSVRLDGTGARSGDCLVPNGRISLQLPLGSYVLEVSDPQSGTVVSTRFTTGASTADRREAEPDMLGVVASAERYAVGETARLQVSAPFDGEVLVAFAENEIVAWKSASTVNRSATIDLRDIPKEWQGKGLYALVTVFRRETDGTSAHGPARAIGTAYFAVTGGERIFELKVSAPRSFPPDAPLPVSVCVAAGDGCAEDFAEAGFATLYAVDEGLINLTAHPVADPYTHFFGQIELPVAMMDNYGRILLHETTVGQGGDRPSRLALSNYTSDRIVSKVIGPVPLENGKARFEVPPLEIDSTIRLVALAWTATGAAADAEAVTVRSSVVARLDVPRFFTPGDKPALPLLLSNRERRSEGPYRVQIKVPEGIKVAGVVDAGGAPLSDSDPATFDIKLPQAETAMAYVSLEIAEGITAPKADIVVTVTDPTEGTLAPFEKLASVPIRPAVPATVETVDLEIEPGAPAISLVEAIAEIAERYEPGAKVQTRVSAGGPIAIAGLAPQIAEPVPVLERLVWSGMVLAHQPPTLGAGRGGERGTPPHRLRDPGPPGARRLLPAVSHGRRDHRRGARLRQLQRAAAGLFPDGPGARLLQQRERQIWRQRQPLQHCGEPLRRSQSGRLPQRDHGLDGL